LVCGVGQIELVSFTLGISCI